MKEIIVNVDNYNENSIKTIEGDNLSEVYKIYICKNKRRIDLTNKIAVMAYVDEYGSKRSNILNLNITDPKEAEIELPITNIISEHNGVYACQVAIYGENNSLEQTAPFSLIVENNIFSKISNTAINSSDFHILSEAIKTTSEYAEKLKEGTENIELQYANKLNEVNTKLEDKANQNDVVFKGQGTLNDFDESTRALLQGLPNGEVQINAVLGIGNVKPINTSFIKTSPNLYDKRSITKNKYVLKSNGTLLDNEAYCVTDYIPINEGFNYRFNGGADVVRWDLACFYKSDKSFLCSTNSSNNPFISPSEAKYIRITLFNRKDAIDNFYFYNGTERLDPPVPYYEHLEEEYIPPISKDKLPKIDDGLIDEHGLSISKMNFAKLIGNLFDATKIFKNKFVEFASGKLQYSENYIATDYIEIEPNTVYATRNMWNQHFAFYDKNKCFISDSMPSNNIAAVFTSPHNAYYVRFSIRIVDKPLDIDNTGIVKGDTYYQTPYEFKIPIDVIHLLNSIKSEYIKDKAIEEKHLSFLENSTNLFNIEAIENDKYVNWTNGVVDNNENYCASEFIPIDPETEYIMTSNRMLAYYNKNKEYISGLENGNSPLVIRTPINAKYIRITVPKNNINDFMFKKGTELGEYESYGYLIPPKMFKQEHAKITLNIPDEINVANNVQYELYNRYVIDKCSNVYYFKYTCSIGQNLKRGLIIPKGTTPGVYPAKLEVFDDNLSKLAFKNFNINVLGKKQEINENKKVLCIGDSLTNNKPWMKVIVDNCTNLFGTNKIDFIGTRGEPYKHEGRSGYTAQGYVTDSGYGFQGNYKIKVNNLTVTPLSKKKYKTTLSTGGEGTFEVETVKQESGSTWVYLNRLNGGGDVKPSGTFKEVDNSVQGDSSLNYTEASITSRNPFWNPNTKQVDFKYYESENSIKPDIVQLYLGTNDYSSPYFIENMKILINALNRDWNIPILVVLVPYRGNQDGMGKQFGTSMFYREAFDIVNKQHKLVLKELQLLHNVTIVPIGLAHDSEHNFGMVEGNINSRNMNKTWYPTESIHPQQCGYEQMGDVIWSNILKFLQ